MTFSVWALKRGTWERMEVFKKRDQADLYAVNLRNMYNEIKIKDDEKDEESIIGGR